MEERREGVDLLTSVYVEARFGRSRVVVGLAWQRNFAVFDGRAVLEVGVLLHENLAHFCQLARPRQQVRLFDPVCRRRPSRKPETGSIMVRKGCFNLNALMPPYVPVIGLLHRSGDNFAALRSERGCLAQGSRAP